MDLISRRTEAVVDALVVAACLTLPRAFGWSRRATRVLGIAGTVVAAASLLGRLRRGGRLIMPPVARRTIDGATGVALFVAQSQLTEEDSPARGAAAGLGAVLVFAALLAGRGRPA